MERINSKKDTTAVVKTKAVMTPEALKQKETMKQIQNKRVVKVFAYMQLIFASLFLVLIVMAVFAATLVTVVNVEKQAEAEPEKKVIDKSALEVILSFMWLTLFCCALVTGFEIWSSMQLLKATEISITTTQRLAHIHSWKMVTIVFTIVDTVALFMIFHYVIAFCFVISRFVFLCEVETLKANLEKKLVVASFKDIAVPKDLEVVIQKTVTKA